MQLVAHSIANANHACLEIVNCLKFLQVSPPIAIYPPDGLIENYAGLFKRGSEGVEHSHSFLV